MANVIEEVTLPVAKGVRNGIGTALKTLSIEAVPADKTPHTSKRRSRNSKQRSSSSKKSKPDQQSRFLICSDPSCDR